MLIKDAEALERMAGIDTLIVDKTGTLTMGKPKLTDTLALGDVAEADLRRHRPQRSGAQSYGAPGPGLGPMIFSAKCVVA